MSEEVVSVLDRKFETKPLALEELNLAGFDTRTAYVLMAEMFGWNDTQPRKTLRQIFALSDRQLLRLPNLGRVSLAKARTRFSELCKQENTKRNERPAGTWRRLDEAPLPRDGTWSVILNDDGSGALMLACLDGPEGRGWYLADGHFDGDGDAPEDDRFWAPLPTGWIPWCLFSSLRKEPISHVPCDKVDMGSGSALAGPAYPKPQLR